MIVSKSTNNVQFKNRHNTCFLIKLSIEASDMPRIIIFTLNFIRGKFTLILGIEEKTCYCKQFSTLYVCKTETINVHVASSQNDIQVERRYHILLYLHRILQIHYGKMTNQQKFVFIITILCYSALLRWDLQWLNCYLLLLPRSRKLSHWTWAGTPIIVDDELKKKIKNKHFSNGTRGRCDYLSFKECCFYTVEITVYVHIYIVGVYDQIKHVPRALALYILYAYTVHYTSIRSVFIMQVYINIMCVFFLLLLLLSIRTAAALAIIGLRLCILCRTRVCVYKELINLAVCYYIILLLYGEIKNFVVLGEIITDLV